MFQKPHYYQSFVVITFFWLTSLRTSGPVPRLSSSRSPGLSRRQGTNPRDPDPDPSLRGRTSPRGPGPGRDPGISPGRRGPAPGPRPKSPRSHVPGRCSLSALVDIRSLVAQTVLNFNLCGVLF